MSAEALKMVRTVVVGTAAVLALEGVVLVTSASAQYSSYSQAAQWQDAAIKRAFRDVLRREPSTSEMRRYRTLMVEDHWSEDDIRFGHTLKSNRTYRRV